MFLNVRCLSLVFRHCGLQLEELAADVAQDEMMAEVSELTSTTEALERKFLSRKEFPKHLPRESVVVVAPGELSMLQICEVWGGRHRDTGDKSRGIAALEWGIAYSD